MQPTAIESLNFLAGILQRMALPAVAEPNQLSHQIVGKHITNILEALNQPQAEAKTDDDKTAH
jgi:hypothetical protein